jgi:hypothetical protein
MTTITLPPEIEAPLAEEARKQGTTPELLALDKLRGLYASTQLEKTEELQNEEGTLFDLLQGYVGTVEGTTEALSEHTGKRFAEGMVEKRQAGKL